MLVGGDEFGRTQHGNNNAYCQDNETSWYDWAAADNDLLAYVKRLIAFRRAHPQLRRRNFGAGDIGYFTPAGLPMSDADWSVSYAKTIVMCLDGSAAEPDAHNHTEPDDDLLIAINAWWEPAQVQLPSPKSNSQWHLEFDTAQGFDPGSSDGPSAAITVPARSIVVLRSTH
jgi:glycogen operon protein